MKKRLLTIATCMLSFFVVNAQDDVINPALSGFEAHVGVTFPNGDFGDEDEGGAATGLNVGIKYYYPLQTKGLSLFVGLDAFYNGLQGDIKDDLEDYINDYYAEGADITHSAYLNIPITAGVNYAHPINEKIKAFGEVGLGFNYSKMTDQKIEWDEYDAEMTTTFNASTTFAYNIGAGISINDKYSIGLKYNNLGTHKYKTKYEIIEDGDTIDKDSYKSDKLSISNIALVVGIRF